MGNTKLPNDVTVEEVIKVLESSYSLAISYEMLNYHDYVQVDTTRMLEDLLERLRG